MPYTKRPRVYRRRRRAPYKRRTRRPTYRRRYKKKSDYNYAKVSTISAMPYNLYTFMRVSTKNYSQILPNPAIGSNPYVSSGWNAYCFSHNAIAPWNFARPSGAPYYLPYGDASFFGPPNQVNAPQSALVTWSGNTWFANRYAKMRILSTWLRFTVRPVQGATYLNPTPELGSNWPMALTWVTARYADGLMFPELLNQLDYDDLRSMKGARTIVFSGIRNKPVSVKVRTHIKTQLGVTDLNDNINTECRINPTMKVSDLTAKLITNPYPNNQIFTYFRVSRPDGSFADPAQLWTYSIQVQATAKVQFYQLQLNNPPSYTGNDNPDNPIEDPWNPAGTSVPI